MKNDILKMFAQKAKRRMTGKENVVNARIKILPNEDVSFKSRVENLLSQEGVISNPVQYLIDESALKGMSEENKERYVLSTLDKYNALRRELENLAAYKRSV
ncbi:MAG: hypothetical protein IJ817_03700 [Clostridia bacterium]|nr:hypothetical protein [Clostridia bacterium]